MLFIFFSGIVSKTSVWLTAIDLMGIQDKIWALCRCTSCDSSVKNMNLAIHIVEFVAARTMSVVEHRLLVSNNTVVQNVLRYLFFNLLCCVFVCYLTLC